MIRADNASLPRRPQRAAGIGRRGALAAALLGCALAAAATTAAPAQEAAPRIALVIGNGDYPGLPPLPGCPGAARAVAEALRRIGMEVIERTDARRGEFDAATGRFARRLTSAPGGAAIAYFCGYAKDFNARTFFLPSGATLGGEYEILTQGVQARTVQDAMVRGDVDSALLAVSAYAPPDTSPASALASLAERGAPHGHAFLGVLEPRPAPGSEQPALGTALAEALTSSPGMPLPEMVAAMQRRIARASPGAIVLADLPGRQGATLTAPPPPPPPAPTPQATAPVPAPAPQATAPVPPAAASQSAAAAQPPPAAPPAPPAAAAAVPAIPDEARMTEEHRRRVQIALATLGYLSGRIDGRFGPETRNAIRRWQAATGADPTGIITGAQATQLVAAAFR